MKAWHFVEETLRDGRPVPPDGEWLVHDGKLVMSESGYHASEQLLDALYYAPGSIICRVEMGGKIIHGADKLVAEKRKILWRVDGEVVLKAFARWCALQVVDKWDAPDVVIEWLTTGDEILRGAAWSAAWSAARSEAYAVAMYAAKSTAWSTAWSAAGYGYAAWYAAWSAARDAVLSTAAARDAQNAQLEKMVREAYAGKTEWIFEVQKEE